MRPLSALERCAYDADVPRTVRAGLCAEKQALVTKVRMAVKVAGDCVFVELWWSSSIFAHLPAPLAVCQPFRVSSAHLHRSTGRTNTEKRTRAMYLVMKPLRGPANAAALV
jgi:hypothetical protein